MEIVYFGSGEFGIECLESLAASEHELCFIVTQPTNLAGRGRKPKKTPVANWAISHSVAFMESDNVNEQTVVDKISEFKPDLIVVIAFGQKVGTQLINLPKNGAINVHASLLPKYRGAAPINWAIVNGEKHTGVTIITLAETIDAGDICAEAETKIAPEENAGQLHDRLAKISAPLLIDTISKIENGRIVYQKQNNADVTKAPKLSKADGFLDFSEPAETLKNKIRGLWPWPEASAIYFSQQTQKSERVVIAEAQIVKVTKTDDQQPGTIDDNLNIICGKNALAIQKIKPAGSHLMAFKDFINGRRTTPGDTFTKINK